MASRRFSSSAAAVPDLEILGDKVTIHPAGYSEPLPRKDGAPERNLVENMARFRQNPFDWLKEVSLYVSGSGWRAYDDIIGQPIFYSGFSDNMKAAVMSTPMLRQKIEELAEKRAQLEDEQGLLGDGVKGTPRRVQRKEELENSLKEVALELTDEMICKMESKRFIRGAYYLCTQLLTRAYHQGVRVSAHIVMYSYW